MSALAIGAMLAGCASSDTATTDASTASPTPLESDRPKQVPVDAPSTSPSADGSGGVTVSASPAPSQGEDQTDASNEGGDPPSGGLDERSEDIARDLLALANSARAEDGTDDLEWSDCAAEQAVDRAATALGKTELEHEELEFECEATLVGENLVRGDGPASALHRLWMESESHRENILNDDFSSVGVGCVAHAEGERTDEAANAADIGGWVCSQMFYG